MNSCLISVIVPVYNIQKYLPKCINSIITQTYSNLEIILVDDGSTDESGIICDEAANRDLRIKVIHKTNGGQGSARNCGLNICKGEYITFLDADDSMHVKCIEKLYDFLIKEDLDISACNYERYSEEGIFLSTFEDSYENFIISGVEAQRRIWYGECINLAPWGKLYKRKLWDYVRFKECRYYEDYATMHLVYLQVTRFGYLHESQIKYLVRKESDVRSFNRLKLLTLDVADETIYYCEKNCIEALDAAIKKAVNMYFHNLFNMPWNEREYKKFKIRILKFLGRYRWHVLSDKRADNKVKCALLLSMFGCWLPQKIYHYKKKKDILF